MSGAAGSPHPRSRTRLVALLLATCSSLLWSAAFIIVKQFLSHVPPVTMIGVRNVIAFAVLITFSRLVLRARLPASMGRSDKALLAVTGVFHAIASGSTFFALSYLPATTLGFYLNSIPIIVVVLGITLLRERPTWLQGIGVLVVMLGAYVFFPTSLSSSEAMGAATVIFGQFGWGMFTILVRYLTQRHAISVVLLSSISVGVNSAVLLTAALFLEGWPHLDPFALLMIALLALVFFALPNLTWNHALRMLPAFEVSVLGNMQPLMTAVLAWLFLSEGLSDNKIAGMLITMLGITIVQWQGTLHWRRSRRDGRPGAKPV